MDALATGEPASPGGATATSVDSELISQQTTKGNSDGGAEANHKATVECRPQESTSTDAVCSFLAAGDGERCTEDAARSVLSTETHVAEGDPEQSQRDTPSDIRRRLRAPTMRYPYEVYFDDPDVHTNIGPSFGDLRAALRRISRVNKDRQTSTSVEAMGKNQDGCKAGERRTGDPARSVVSSEAQVVAGEPKRSGRDTSSDTGYRLRTPMMWYLTEGDFGNPDAGRNVEPAFGDLNAALRKISRVNEDRQTSTNAEAKGKNHDSRKHAYRGRTMHTLSRNFDLFLRLGEIDRLHVLRVMRESERDEEK